MHLSDQIVKPVWLH